jgi:hypothetical protein
MSAVQFEVAYEFGEYRQFAIEHGSNRSGRRLGLFGRTFLSVIALPVFLFKVSKVGRCSFSVDGEGIVRASNAGKLTVPWSKVTAVHRYTPGLLIEKREGGYADPVPLSHAFATFLAGGPGEWLGIGD